MNHIDLILLKITEKLASNEVCATNYEILRDLKEKTIDSSHLKSELHKIANLFSHNSIEYLNEKLNVSYKNNESFFDKNADWFLSEVLNNERIFNELKDKAIIELVLNTKIELLIKSNKNREDVVKTIIFYAMNNSLGIPEDIVDSLYYLSLKDSLKESYALSIIKKTSENWSLFVNFEIHIKEMQSDRSPRNQVIELFRLFCLDFESESSTSRQLKEDLIRSIDKEIDLYSLLINSIEELKEIKGSKMDQLVIDWQNSIESKIFLIKD